VTTTEPRSAGLIQAALDSAQRIFWTPPSAILVEEVVRREEALLGHFGSVIVRTGEHTGRSPSDKYIVRNAETEGRVWWGKVNQPLPDERFEVLLADAMGYVRGRQLFVQDAAAGADPQSRRHIRIVSELAWHNLFARNLFLRLPSAEAGSRPSDFTIFHLPGFRADPERHGTRSPVCIVLDLQRQVAIIGGTSYAGEVKKMGFTLMNYLLPLQGVLSMHCSANIGPRGDVALFFGLSGTGKTTLSTVPDRGLIGDDEHGWGEGGVFNFEGGCYAKAIRLREAQEPIIWKAVHRFGTVLENVVVDPESRRVDFEDERWTENTRAAYPLDYIENHVPGGRAGHPRTIFFLTADASGVLPPIARLTPHQAMYYFLSGYTSKLAGTEKGLGTEPEATFSTCFGAPFLPLPPGTYAGLLHDRIGRHQSRVWLVNTGWSGGAFGQGSRISLKYTRAVVAEALSGILDTVPTRTDPIFGFEVPLQCPGIPDAVLDPRLTWPDPEAYDGKARELASRFVKNFTTYENQVDAEVRQAGPRTA
jgi:phosphoenolpyruvate carboxykinase (ATP)